MMLKIVVPITPPSVNHYSKQRVAVVNGNHTVMHYPGKEAKAWWKAVAACAGGRNLDAPFYELAYVVYQGNNERGDVDNYAKCIQDSLVKASVITSDHLIIALHGYKKRDRDNPRTEIFLRAAGQLGLFGDEGPPLPVAEDWF